MRDGVLRVPWPVTVTYTFTCAAPYCPVVEVVDRVVVAGELVPMVPPPGWALVDQGGRVRLYCGDHLPTVAA